MARSDLVIKMIQSGLRGDSVSVRRVAETIAADERGKKHDVIAMEIENVLRRSKMGMEQLNDVNHNSCFSMPKVRGEDLVVEKLPSRKFNDLVLPSQVHNVLDALSEEYLRADILFEYALSPRNRILLIGAPGNGKTSIAEAIAASIMVPLYTVRYETLIGSYLGETAARISNLFDFVKTRRCVLFMDEFDAIGKERGDAHDVGEVKRVVSTLLTKIDELPSHVMAVAATNHPELLDRAVWRRFQVTMDIPSPDMDGINEFIKRFELKVGVKFGARFAEFVAKQKSISYAEIEELCLAVMRNYVLSMPNGTIGKAVSSVLKDRVELFIRKDKSVCRKSHY